MVDSFGNKLCVIIECHITGQGLRIELHWPKSGLLSYQLTGYWFCWLLENHHSMIHYWVSFKFQVSSLNLWGLIRWTDLSQRLDLVSFWVSVISLISPPSSGITAFANQPESWVRLRGRRRESNPGPSVPESDVLTTRPLRLRKRNK